MPLETIEVETGPNPTASMLVLHGLGADGNDFVPVAQELDLREIGSVRFVFPHAPTMPVTINGGYVMRAWYDILGTDLVRREDERGLRQSQLLVEALIAQERARGVASTRIVLAGFSQGCALTLMTGLRCAERLAPHRRRSPRARTDELRIRVFPAASRLCKSAGLQRVAAPLSVCVTEHVERLPGRTPASPMQSCGARATTAAKGRLADAARASSVLSFITKAPTPSAATINPPMASRVFVTQAGSTIAALL